ncbi:MAG: hypothetical protein WDM81_21845 [Rhizomicrobium sp.]
MPNDGNPQKVQRYPWERAKGLREMAAKAPASFCPGHGGPVVDDPKKIARMLTETAEFLETVVSPHPGGDGERRAAACRHRHGDRTADIGFALAPADL